MLCALCRVRHKAHGRRKHFELAELTKAPLAIEAVRRIDAIFAAERAINGQSAEARLAARRQDIKPMVDALEAWMRAERPRLSRHAEAAKAMDYMLKRWPAFTRFLDDGRICLSTPPSASFVPWRSGDDHGCSRVPTAAASGRR